MYVNGEWIQTDFILEVLNPVDGQKVGEVFQVGSEETKEAIDAASEAFKQWSKLTADTRANYLHQLADQLVERKEHFAQIITKEMGKPIVNARYEVDSAVSYFKWFAEEARRVYGEIIPSPVPNKRISVIKQPLGVVAAITPWNFPLSMVARKLGPALAVGCTVVLRPSREAPLSSLELIKLMDEIGFPKGVVNLLIGGTNEIVGPIMESKTVRKVTFTGSTDVGKILVKQAADTLKRVSMELGGHAPFIVFEDADLDLAVEGAIKSKFSSAGQQCVCSNRIYVHETIYDEFARKFTERSKALVVGDGIDESTNIGPLVNEAAVEKVDSQVQDAVAKGALVLCGGNNYNEGSLSKGSFYAPTVLGNVTEEMVITYEETFGPVAPLIKFSDEDEVIQKANDIEYGLVAYFYTNDGSRVHRVAEKLEYGMVGINDAAPFTAQAPFGGIKESGSGREGGRQGIEDYIDIKTISHQIQL
ncbi:Succinate-semialdehyde dehydrogenase [NADP(+)] GabD [Solibacillus isronensis B3W22]|uniref:Succinate-semialdehyde dehydrogenase [NADP(+)] GabD n=1 Tax=Solibacillus isronensis B3W22 TaxID=1224748 RepID=K1LLL5_9BACL|nr:NAD-dependent succinate-semialdehyde dehydrogenase [Solibacillus isronensis]AMO86574.1 NAD-dependent succinate-semialdehyde dehydrogenase [Solibacillus silvestris]EKB45154.1 Succinate-semialdehyde dehydrogenase [NADP(+)] GabD [Solibacillus isronensis B3W22]